MMALDTLRSTLAAQNPGRLEWEQAVLASGWPELDAALPDHGFPRGVIELAAPRALGGGTSIALAVVRAAQENDARAWCAWVDTEGTLYAPAVAWAGVDLGRLLVVRPPRASAGRVAVKVAEAHACTVLVVDGLTEGRDGSRARALKPEILIRKLALAAERGGATILLLTDSLAPRQAPWPVALRLVLGRAPGHLVVKVGKDRRGRVGVAKAVVPMKTRPCWGEGRSEGAVVG
jgi:recombination protein RecA